MCYESCKEFRGWCRAFTPTEVILSILEAVLLILLLTFLTFLTLHLIACVDEIEKFRNVIYNESTSQEFMLSNTSSGNATVPAGVACTWTPSANTQAVTHYFEDNNQISPIETTVSSSVTVPNENHLKESGVFDSNQFNDKPTNDKKNFIMGLVKMKPPDEITFGCILTIISEFWTLTAASCIESIKEIDSLDSFVMMKNFGEPRYGRTHAVSDVLVHPQFQGFNNTYDIVALKSEDKLTTGGDKLPQLPTLLDYLLLAIGDRLTVLGFGKFRGKDKDSLWRGAHSASVHALPGAQCGAGAGSLCAGPLCARRTPCNYCAGAPLMRARVLLGLMSAPGHCGARCEPALYVNLAAMRHWGILACSLLMAAFVASALGVSALQLAAAAGARSPLPALTDIT